MNHIFDIAMEAAYRSMADVVAYIPIEGVQFEVNAFPIFQDADVGYGESEFIAASKIFEVRSVDVSSPKIGDRIQFNNITYEVIETPEYKDDRQIIWVLGVKKL